MLAQPWRSSSSSDWDLNRESVSLLVLAPPAKQNENENETGNKNNNWPRQEIGVSKRRGWLRLLLRTYLLSIWSLSIRMNLREALAVSIMQSVRNSLVVTGKSL